MSLPRPLTHLRDLTTRYPEAWSAFEGMRADRGHGLPNWPEWVYLPIAGAYAVVSEGERLGLEDVERVQDVARLASLGAWRMTKGVYRFDEDIFNALWQTPIKGDLPSELLLRLPEWCVYIETRGREVMGVPLHGFYAQLEYNVNDGRRELRLLLDYEAGLSSLPIHLTGSLEAGLEAMTHEGELSASALGLDVSALRARFGHSEGANRLWATEAAPLLSLLLYLCSERPDIAGKGEPGNPQPKRVKSGLREFAAPGVRPWEVAYRLGAAYRQAQAHEDTEPMRTGTGRQRPRPFMRSAHWATYWTGPKTAPQIPVLRWRSPVLVNAGGDLPATVRRVENDEK